MTTRIAVVTGAAGGLGRAFVDRLLADGLTVVGVDIDGAALLAMAADRVGFVAEAVDLVVSRKWWKFEGGVISG